MKKTTLSATLAALVAAVLLFAVPVAHADYEQGMAYFKQGKYVEAASEFQAVLENAPEYDFGHFMLGNCYFKLKKYRDAEQAFRKAIEIESGKFNYHYMLAQTLLALRKYSEVVTTLDKAVELAQSPAEKRRLYKLRGIALARIKQYDRAIEDLKRANPAKDFTVAKELGRACYIAGDYSCAIDSFQKADALRKNDPLVLKMLAKAMIEKARRTRDKKAKEALFRRAAQVAARYAKVETKKVDPHEIYGAALLGANDFNGAIREFREVLKRDPKSCTAMLNIAQAYLALEKWNDVITWGKKAVSCDPKNYLGYQQLAFAYIKLKNNWDEAIRMAEKAVALKDTPQTRKVLADAKKGKEAAEYIARQKEEEERIKRLQEEERRRQEEMQRKIKEYEARTGRKLEGGGGGKKD